MITTIQLKDDVKKALERLKTGKETYEEIIVKMMEQIESDKKNHEMLLIEECKEMAEENLRITKEWESTDEALDWEWNEDL